MEGHPTLNDVWQAYQELPPSASGHEDGTYRALALPSHEGVYLARSDSDSPLFLIEPASFASEPGMSLSQMRVSHGVRAQIGVRNVQIRQCRVSTVECLAEASTLQQLFVTCLANALPEAIADRTEATINRLIRYLVELFAAASGPSRPSAGLWAELLIIARSANPTRCVVAWHSQSDAHYDFVADNERLEVKATARSERWHDFSLEQLNPPSGIVASVASLIVEARTDGLTLGQLRSECLDAAGEDFALREKIDRLCVSYLGSSWPQALDEAFDEQAALASLQLYDTGNIPKIEAPAPPGVAAVRFRSCLDLATPMRSEELQQRPLAGSIGR